MMIEKLWYGKNRLFWLLIPFSLLYGIIAFVRRFLYKMGIFKSWHSPVPIIVIGNLSVGGNGKTPLAISLIEALEAKGLKVGLVSRGYGGKAENYPLILDNTTTTDQAGDEPVLIYQRTHVPVAVSPNRCQAVKALLKKNQLDVILTDDGLQHYALARDIEIVVVDGKRLFGNNWWMPAGPMRERSNRLKSVDLIIVNGDSVNNLVEQYPDKTYTMQLIPKYVINLLTKEKKELSSLSNICAVAGISNPQRFFDMLISMKADLNKTVAFADHQKFSLSLLNNVARREQTLLMTEKDAVKCQLFAEPNWWFLPIDAVIPKPAIDHICLLLDKINLKENKK
ncbi:tetraacyldisaccharide 4'-kinase [Gilliamella sp. B2779]|nr:tetraacyldisaccharide 4'-kinase [Gilliamella sp. B2779]MCX8657077.1 tetraacyldisaccharide 4'-kinase [Gilliamella sp. B2894]MCX8665800.1 tetraacyldisaccharide 4'-kinase [Gilliamella sp. B2887]MCX8693802.1 tetraacyldisaccharide 4'-kinase [Gilliamella sp. B2881]MCX8697009.1 tetraacyldisaccharide 4'-kinase [Gilliamella sp. B2828]MCX8698115.1 tetraacyldisaccharide 4'-kinase [Gilliamella sp. B3000]MCX8703705.1 tetraacyldisaccharide 4'-kinase [Gilliamella sp. B2781]WDM18261.1 tetraacyldisacchari